jgi:hypothetical protein
MLNDLLQEIHFHIDAWHGPYTRLQWATKDNDKGTISNYPLLWHRLSSLPERLFDPDQSSCRGWHDGGSLETDIKQGCYSSSTLASSSTPMYHVGLAAVVSIMGVGSSYLNLCLCILGSVNTSLNVWITCESESLFSKCTLSRWALIDFKIISPLVTGVQLCYWPMWQRSRDIQPASNLYEIYCLYASRLCSLG